MGTLKYHDGTGWKTLPTFSDVATECYIRVERSAQGIISNTSGEVLVFNTVSESVGQLAPTLGADGKVTVWETGEYTIVWNGYWSDNNSGRRWFFTNRLSKGVQTTISRESMGPPTSGDNPSVTASTTVRLLAGDVVWAMPVQDCGSTLQLNSAWMTVTKVAPGAKGEKGDPGDPGNEAYIQAIRTPDQNFPTNSGNWQVIQYNSLQTTIGSTAPTLNTGNGTVTITETGEYTISAHGYFADNATGRRMFSLWAGGNLIARTSPGVQSANSPAGTINTTIRLQAGAQITSQLFQDSGATLAFIGASITVTKVGPGSKGDKGDIGYDTAPLGAVITTTRSIWNEEYVLANGQTLTEVAYPDCALVAATEVAAGNTLWTISGTAPNRTFTVPDLRDRFVYGSGAAKPLGTKSSPGHATYPGAETHVLTTAQMPSHTHNGPTVYPANFAGSMPQVPYGTTTSPYNNGFVTLPTGGDLAHNNMPPYCVLAFLVKVKGVAVIGSILQGPKGEPGGSATVPIEGWHAVGGAGEPAFQNGWSSYSVSYPVQYRKLPDGVVEMRGLLAPGTINTVAFTLPADYRPMTGVNEVYFSCPAWSGSAYCISTVFVPPSSGGVQPQALTGGTLAAGGYISLNGVRFTTSQTTFPTGPKGDKGDSSSVPIEDWKLLFAGSYNNWQDYGGSYPAQYRKRPDGIVEFRGLVKSGNNGQSCALLPVGYRIPSTHAQFYFPTVAHNGSAYIDHGLWISPAGEMRSLYNAWGAQASGWFALDGISYATDQTTFPAGPQGPKGDTGGNATADLDIWHKIGAAGEPAFANGWVAVAPDSTYHAPAFRRDPFGKVRLRGVISTGTAGNYAFQLPVGYRPGNPARTMFMAVDSNGAHGRITIDPSGYVIPGIGSVSSFILDNIEFDSDTVTSYMVGPQGPPGPPGARPPLMDYLPVGVSNGYEIYFQTAAMLAASVPPWHLRYNTGYGDAYKWDVINAQPLGDNYSGQMDSSSTSYADISTCSIAVPLAGYYTHRLGIYAYNNTAGSYGVANVRYGAASESAVHEVVVQGVNACAYFGESYYPTVMLAGTSIVGRWKAVSGGIARLYRATLVVTPARVG